MSTRFVNLVVSIIVTVDNSFIFASSSSRGSSSFICQSPLAFNLAAASQTLFSVNYVADVDPARYTTKVVPGTITIVVVRTPALFERRRRGEWLV
jgi:peptidyl-tRNA hydrolase